MTDDKETATLKAKHVHKIWLLTDGRMYGIRCNFATRDYPNKYLAARDFMNLVHEFLTEHELINLSQDEDISALVAFLGQRANDETEI